MKSFRKEFERTESTLVRHSAVGKERLINAVINGIARLCSNEYQLNKMPPELREEFLNLMNDLV